MTTAFALAYLATSGAAFTALTLLGARHQHLKQARRERVERGGCRGEDGVRFHGQEQ